jgi:hypothetical protein
MECAERFLKKVDKSGECWNWTAGTNTYGYGQININKVPVKAHRLSYVLHHPLTIDLLEGHREIFVCHRCDNPLCVNPAHLFLGSYLDNIKDMVQKKRHYTGQPEYEGRKGETNVSSKLTDDIVREIRTRYANGDISQTQLSVEYNVTNANICSIVNRKTWKHI